jgi:hypothetical protein
MELGDLSLMVAMPSLRNLLLRIDRTIRSKALRAIRYLLVNADTAQAFLDLGIDIFVCRSVGIHVLSYTLLIKMESSGLWSAAPALRGSECRR